MSATTAASIACPPWCEQHWVADDDPHQYTHLTSTRYFAGPETAVVGADLCVILDTSCGCCAGPFVYVAQTPLEPAEAKRLAEHILTLVEAVERG